MVILGKKPPTQITSYPHYNKQFKSPALKRHIHSEHLNALECTCSPYPSPKIPIYLH